MPKIVQSITELIGRTPLVKLNHVIPEGAANVYVKLEFFNPGGSLKDRIALNMLRHAEESGALKPGDTIVEPTSGNTGVGLAMVAAAKGYPAIFVMPETMSIERRKLLKAYGAQLILTPGPEGMKGAVARAEKLAQKPSYFMPSQFENPNNPAIHEWTTGVEILEAFDGKSPDAFVAGVGTGGTITGVGHVLRTANPTVEIIAVEPAESPVLSGGSPAPHKIQGIGAGFIPHVLDQKVYDEIIQVKSEDAIQMGREVAQKEGILVGISSGATILAAIEIAKKLGKGKNVVAIVADNGERYLSTTLYADVEV